MEAFTPLSSNRIAAGIAFAALILSFAILVVLKGAGALDNAKTDPALMVAGGVLWAVAIALIFGMPLALKRLRDPRLRHRDWAATGALGGLMAALLFNLLIVAAALIVPNGMESGDMSLGIGVIAIFAGCTLAGAAVGALARAIAVSLNSRRP